MTISPPDALLGARAPRVRKVPRYGASAGQEAIELAATAGLFLDPWQQDVLIDVMGERPDGTWTAKEVAVIVARQNGKGALLEARELFGLFLAGEKELMHTAHELKTSLQAFKRIKGLIQSTRDLERRVKRFVLKNGAESIELWNGAELKFVARSKGSGRGFTGDLLVLDEAYALTEAHMEALLPTLSARPNSQIWYTSSPPLDAASGEPLFKVKDRAEAGEPGLAYFDWSAEPGVDLDDRTVWEATNPALGIRISEESIARERSQFTDVGFGRERLCIWPPRPKDGWAVIPEEDWRLCVDLMGEVGDPVAFAIDVAPDRSYTSIAMAGRRPDGLGQVEVADHRPGTAWVPARVLELRERWKPCVIVLDVIGPGGSLAPDIEAQGLDVAKPIELEKPSARDVAAACGAFWDAVSGVDEDGLPRRTLRHRDQAELATALAGAAKRTLGDAWAWSRRDTTVDISPLVAVTLALWGFSKFGHVEPDDLADNVW